MSDARESKVSAWVLAAAVFLASRWGEIGEIERLGYQDRALKCR